MKKLITVAASLSAICLVILFAACKKTSSSHNISALGCKIVGITDNNNGAVTNYSLSYTGDGKITTVTAKGFRNFKRIFSYGSNMIYIAGSDATGVNERDTVIMDANQLVTAIHRYYSASSSYNNSIMTYDTGNELSALTFVNNTGTNTIHYTWRNGDLVQSSNGVITMHYAYDTSTSVKDGDYLKINMLLQYGVCYINNTHLVKGVSGGTAENYSYTTTGNGDINTLTITDGTKAETLSYQYECHM